MTLVIPAMDAALFACAVAAGAAEAKTAEFEQFNWSYDKGWSGGVKRMKRFKNIAIVNIPRGSRNGVSFRSGSLWRALHSDPLEPVEPFPID